MRIVCPACAAAYEVPEDRFAPGLVVRCARCGTDWTPEPPAPIAVAAQSQSEPEPEPEFEPDPELEFETEPESEPEPTGLLGAMASGRYAVSRQRAKVSALSVAWLMSVMLLSFFLLAAFVERDSIMRVWPPSVRAYAAIGLAE